MKDKAILHSDMNSFYASVEMMLDPSLKNKAIVVCGNSENRHGIVLAKSELAKKAGIKTGMANWQAKKLYPNLIMVHPHYDQYLKYSKLAHEIYYRYTDLVEPFGMDECWLDVTNSKIFGSPMEIAEAIRSSIKEELGLTVSIGVSFSKVFAKLGSDMKKPDAITQITKENFKEKIWGLPASDLIYIGKATENKLASHGIYTIGQLADLNPETLRSWFGINGIKLWHYANGSDNSRVMQKDFISPIKSIGHGVTCKEDLNNNEEVYKTMLELSQDVGHRLRINGFKAQGIQLTIRNKDLSFRQYQTKLELATHSPKIIADSTFELFKKRYLWLTTIRSITIRAIDLVSETKPQQFTLFIDPEEIEKRDRLDNAIEDIRNRFGKSAVMNAVLLNNEKMPTDDRDKVLMPNIMFQ